MISNLGYIVLGVNDLDAWERFAVDVVGMQVGRREPGVSLGLRMDDFEQRILLQSNSADDMLAAGWEFDTEGDLLNYVEGLREHGVEVADVSAELADARRVERLFSCIDANGMFHEFYYGARRAALSDAFHSKVLCGPFVTGRLGVGHFVAVDKHAGATSDFYEHILGVKISDYIRGEVIPGKEMEVKFFHSATGRHHSVATAQVPFPVSKIIHHIMVEVADMNDVGLAYDRCIAAGVPVEMEFGHHPNDGMFSFYVKTPSGFFLEFGYGGIVVDDATWEVKRYSQLSDWGHRHPPRS
ncbi:VOC family protein [Pseudomonas aeruginosa]|uniref:VOC family protein n=1 Tax=Pseudomonas aeruginosa TaxID=287 RepID=UPI0007A82510|nr:VOC family protein [Pseudomonas aeruginosa]KYO76840.1 Iron-dependent extradiol dioxygenase [Pseudomonas aeruginosa]